MEEITEESGLDLGYFRDNYQLICYDEDLADYVLRKLSNRDPENDKIPEWTVEGSSESGWEAVWERISYQEFLVNRFKKIAAAPDIEVAKVSPATHWHFRNPTPLRSVAELAKSTADLLNNNLFEEDFADAEAPIELYGIWDTGVWLFHEDGWAWPEIGKRLVEDLLPNKKLKVNLVLTNIPPAEEGEVRIRAERAARAKEVQERLEHFGKERCKLHWVDWWDRNRSLTLLCRSTKDAPQGGGIGGIYMRRRLGTPLVAPVYVDHKDDCKVLGDIFKFYMKK